VHPAFLNQRRAASHYNLPEILPHILLFLFFVRLHLDGVELFRKQSDSFLPAAAVDSAGGWLEISFGFN
jgi:hypothetical protein